MAVKTANVIARVEPQIKEQAEQILSSLGITASNLINMLYRQVILTRGIPFTLELPKAKLPSRDSMTDDEFIGMLKESLEDVRQGRSEDADVVFDRIRKEVLHA